LDRSRSTGNLPKPQAFEPPSCSRPHGECQIQKNASPVASSCGDLDFYKVVQRLPGPNHKIPRRPVWAASPVAQPANLSENTRAATRRRVMVRRVRGDVRQRPAVPVSDALKPGRSDSGRQCADNKAGQERRKNRGCAIRLRHPQSPSRGRNWPGSEVRPRRLNPSGTDSCLYKPKQRLAQFARQSPRQQRKIRARQI